MKDLKGYLNTKTDEFKKILTFTLNLEDFSNLEKSNELKLLELKIKLETQFGKKEIFTINEVIDFLKVEHVINKSGGSVNASIGNSYNYSIDVEKSKNVNKILDSLGVNVKDN